MKAKAVAMMAVAGLVLLGATDALAQRRSSGGRNSSWSYYGGRATYSQPATYKVGSTTYASGQYYQSGYPKVERSSAVRSEFLSQRGYSSTPAGYQVDHVVPLSQGGADATYNMQLLPTSMHRAKTAQERSW
ncbi:MAG TPA: HNH endonuclease signature motif containing protein [Kiritimatiellia bacterium]|nr:HNH endonuclease signature motif containing protein [Kiritimatiellia bacterium]